MTGAAGSSGAGGIPGVAGTGESCLPGPVQECPLSLCGNGARDECTAPAGYGFCPFVPQVERCDGSDLGGQTCRTAGYGSGTLACSTTCSLDTAGCTECLPLDASLLRCGAAPFSAPALATGIAATDSEVAVAWLELDATSRPSLGFARLTPSLDLIGTTRLMNADGARAIDPAVAKVRVTPLPSGWVVAGSYERELFIHAVSATGDSAGRTTMAVLPNSALSAGPVLAARPDGGPLLVWVTPEGLRTSVISADGRSVTPPATIAPLASSPTAAVAGDAFYVAFVAPAGSNSAQLRVVRIGFDGEIGAIIDVLPGQQIGAANLVSGGDHLRVMHSTPGGETMWQRISFAGEALDPSVPIDVGAGLAWSFAALPFGAETVGLLTGDGGERGAVGVLRLATDGRVVAPPRVIAAAQPWAFGSVDVALRGPDVVVLWGMMRLARLTP
jgi:hypothetical protein